MKRWLPSLFMLVASTGYAFFYLRQASDHQSLASDIVLGLLLLIIASAAAGWALIQKSTLRIPVWFFAVLFFLCFLSLNYFGEVQYTSIASTISNAGGIFFYSTWLLVRILLVYGAYTLIAALVGEYIVRLLRLKSSQIYWILSLGCGFMFIAAYVYGLAVLSLVYSWALAPLVILAFCNVKGLREVVHQVRASVISFRTKKILLLSNQSLWFFSIALLGSYLAIHSSWPVVVNGDSLIHYYEVPHLMVLHHGFVDFPFWPLGKSLFTFAYLYIPVFFFDQSILNFLALFAFTLSVPVLLALSRRFVSEDRAWLVPWFTFMIPMNLIYLLVNPKIDYLNIYFLLIGCLCFFEAQTSKKNILWLLSASFFSFAFSIKFNSLLLIPGLYLLFEPWRALWHRDQWIPLLKKVFFFSLALGGTLVAWNLKSYLMTGMFFYPYSSGKFYYLAAQTIADRSFLDTFFTNNFYYETLIGFHVSLWQNIVNFFHVGLVTQLFNFGPLLFMMIAAALWLLFNKRYRSVALLVLVSLVIWYIKIRVIGYYFDFLIPFGALLVVAYYDHVASWVRRYTILLVGLIMLINCSSTSIGQQILFVHKTLPASDIKKFAKPYILADALKKIIDANPKALFVSATSEVFVMNDSNLHRYHTMPVFYLALKMNGTSTPEEARAKILADGVTHLIYSTSDAMWQLELLKRCEAHNAPCTEYKETMRKTEAMIQGLTPVASVAEYQIYQL